ncbi:MAG: RsmE family RNA methyltransferase, partial [Candidatus Sumerlaeota bacterium]|nr:RsmE family RNA methyltransferase [Candidatus Sumerlaeota bacterium]
MPPRFYLARPIGADEAVVVLDREESHHLVRALRLGAGDEARVFDSTGAEFRVIVERASARGAEVRVAQRLVALRPEQRRLTLAVSLIRNEPMSWLVQKATELGVERLQPFVSERTTAAKAEEVSSTHSPQAESSEARRRRWERVSLAACKQSGRARPIAVGATMRFERLVGELAAAPLA